MERRLTPGRAAAAAACLALLVHLGALANGFAYDDQVLIVGDPGIRSLDGLGQRLLEPSWPAIFGDEIGAWRPVTTGSWALVWIVLGGGSVAFHALGLALHAAATALGVLVLAELVPLTIAASAGLIFAVHPVHVEAVANVAGSAELLAACFGLAALLLHARGGARYGMDRIAAVTLCYALAVLSKEGAAALPLLVLLLDGARLDLPLREVGGYVRRRGTLYASLATALAVILLVRLDVVGALVAASHPPGAEALRDATRVWSVFATWPQYARLLFFPASLAADYAPALVPVLFGWGPQAVLGVGVGLASFIGAWVLWRRSRPLDSAAPDVAATLRVLPFGLLWIAAALLPVSNVLYLGPVLVAERTLYLASWGAALVLAWGCAALAEARGRAAWVLLGALVLAGGVRSAVRVPVWKDSDSVMQALIEEHPGSGTGWLHLGRRLAAQGRTDDARTAFGYAVAFLNSEYRPITELSSHLVATGRAEQARPLLRRAWREHPEWYTAPGLLAAAELATGRPRQAAAAARAASFLQPSNPSMHHLLAQALAASGDWVGAARARRASLDAGFADRGRSWLLLARDLLQAGDTTVASLALDSAMARTLNADEVAQLAELRAAAEGTAR